MARYIDVDTVAFDITGLAWISPYNFRGIAFYFLEQLNSMPTADVRENVRGEWIDTGTAVDDDTEVKCSICGEVLYWKANFCPNCGADMRPDNAPLADDDSIYG